MQTQFNKTEGEIFAKKTGKTHLRTLASMQKDTASNLTWKGQ